MILSLLLVSVMIGLAIAIQTSRGDKVQWSDSELEQGYKWVSNGLVSHLHFPPSKD
jgi:hypothetical protein